jgi:hypothetical protein
LKGTQAWKQIKKMFSLANGWSALRSLYRDVPRVMSHDCTKIERSATKAMGQLLGACIASIATADSFWFWNRPNIGEQF